MKIGNLDITNPKIGNVEINKVYSGVNLVWERVVTTPFIFRIDTTLGSGTQDFTYSPVTSGVVSYSIDWDDGNTTTVLASGDVYHAYSSHGIYDIKVTVISGMDNYRIGFPAPDYLKSTKLLQYGNFLTTDCESLVYGANSSIDCVDVINVVGSARNGLRAASGITNISLNLDLCTSLEFTFRATSAVDWSFLLNTEIPVLTNGANCMTAGNNFDTTTYQLLLVHWTGWNGTTATKSLQNNVSFHFGTAQYEIGGDSEDARNYLINTLGWTITDGGGI